MKNNSISPNSLSRFHRAAKLNYCNRPHGFTLIELLTVIAIIGILASILIPVVAKVRESAHAVVCASNIRQISMAMLIFTDDNDGRLPTSGDRTKGEQPTDWIFWRSDLRDSPIVPYLGGAFDPDIYRCPIDERERIRTGDPDYPFSYSMNRELGEDRPLNGNLYNVRDPSRILFLVEEDTPNDPSAWLRDHEDHDDDLTDRHGGRAHVSFLDGHVEAVYPEYATYRPHWDPFSTISRPYTGRR